MIQLTRLNRSCVTVNPDLIKWIEQSPDTLITLLNGEKLLVRETTEEILDRIVKFRRSILQGATSILLPGGITEAAECNPDKSADKAER
jgi:flagellar protein FlbD